jgi:ribonuclease P/MRP protein subunit RPP40
VRDNGILPFQATPIVDHQPKLSTVAFSSTTVLEALASLKPSRAIGPEGLSPFFYKKIAAEIANPLTRIFTLSLKQGSIPDLWSTARVVPIYKMKGNAGEPSNYRPISLTATPCRLMESCLRDSMLRFALSNDLIKPDQHGFLPGRSTSSQLLLLLDRLTNAVDIGIPSDVIYFDFRKAFESVVPSKLIFKLRLLGFEGEILNWIEAFISNRSQAVVVDGCLSPPLAIVSGVPQGSVLGPLLFILYLNDLQCQQFPVDQEKFADDLRLSSEIITDADPVRLAEAISYVSHWADEWQLPIATQKCAALHIGHSNERAAYALNGQGIPQVDSIKDLGVLFSSDLKFSAHCSVIAANAFRRLALVRRCFSSGNPPILVWAFGVYVRPLLEYASQVWSPYLLSDVDRIESVQRSFTKSLPGMRNLSYGARLGRLGMVSLELRRLWADLALVFKILTGQLGVDLPFFGMSVHSQTRGHSLKCSHQRYRLDCRRSFFAVRVTKAWNSLPESVVTATSTSNFKRHLHKTQLDSFLLRPAHAVVLP